MASPLRASGSTPWPGGHGVDPDACQFGAWDAIIVGLSLRPSRLSPIVGLMRIAVLTVSDAGVRGERADTSGDAIVAWAGDGETS